MDELEKAAIEASAKAVLEPFTKPLANLIGVMGGDQLEEYRITRRERRKKAREDLTHRTREILLERKVEPDPETPPEYLEDIVTAAQDNGVSELKELYARLAAAAVDPKRRNRYRRAFVDLVKQFEPLDTLVLEKMEEAQKGSDPWYRQISKPLNVGDDDIIVSGLNLERLGLIEHRVNVSKIQHGATLTELGRLFLSCVK